MAYFHCLIGGGSSGGGYELTVTCDANFAGTTITCTDGVTTLTQTCPSASPYEVVFEIPNGGDWTISGVVGGQTVSTGVNIPTSAELIATVQQTVTIYSAKEDTISYTDIDGATQTIKFASGATSKQVQITINPNGSSITFTSSVAKNPNNLSQDYSKTFTITPSTTELYLMPDTLKTLYWWGYESDNLKVDAQAYKISTSQSSCVACSINRGTNKISFSGTANAYSSFALLPISSPSDVTKVGVVVRCTSPTASQSFICLTNAYVNNYSGIQERDISNQQTFVYKELNIQTEGYNIITGRTYQAYVVEFEAFWYE